jgi:hypothetical protein
MGMNKRTEIVPRGQPIHSGNRLKDCFRGIHAVLCVWKAIHCGISARILMLFVLSGFAQSCNIHATYGAVNHS